MPMRWYGAPREGEEAQMARTGQGAGRLLGDLAWYRTKRDTEPVWWDPEIRLWNVYRYQDVAAILADHDSFSSDFEQVFPGRAELTEGNILAMDPPRHRQFRSLVSQAFTPRAIARLEPRIAELTAELTEDLLDRTAGRTRIELVADLAYPLPVTVIAELLGVPAADRPRFKVWADALLAHENMDPRDTEELDKVTAELRKFHDYLREHVERRRASPSADLLTELVAAEIDGQRLTDQEIVGVATVLLLAGHITTTLLLGNALLCLDEHPEAQDALRADPASIPRAVEEVLRYRSPVTHTTRVTATEVRIGDTVIGPGELVAAWLLSANHDERQFEPPDEFVVDRHPNPHVAFGKGIHFCIGAPLARLEARVALGVLLRRCASIRVDPDHPLEPYGDRGFNG